MSGGKWRMSSINGATEYDDLTSATWHWLPWNSWKPIDYWNQPDMLSVLLTWKINPFTPQIDTQSFRPTNLKIKQKNLNWLFWYIDPYWMLTVRCTHLKELDEDDAMTSFCTDVHQDLVDMGDGLLSEIESALGMGLTSIAPPSIRLSHLIISLLVQLAFIIPLILHVYHNEGPMCFLKSSSAIPIS